ncbi:hypothetical protein DFJ74DRAFT_707914 [Hyaloraphidium curvatum]|nr:hypothetical protein DFJ74DRAFT_707914 [Hyaloraphidium curvatum]
MPRPRLPRLPLLLLLLSLLALLPPAHPSPLSRQRPSAALSRPPGPPKSAPACMSLCRNACYGTCGLNAFRAHCAGLERGCRGELSGYVGTGKGERGLGDRGIGACEGYCLDQAGLGFPGVFEDLL